MFLNLTKNCPKKILQAIIKLLNHNFFFSLSFCPHVPSIYENAIFRFLKDFVFMAFFVFLGFETEIKVLPLNSRRFL